MYVQTGFTSKSCILKPILKHFPHIIVKVLHSILFHSSLGKEEYI